MQELDVLTLLLQNAERRVIVLERICIQQEQIINPLKEELREVKNQLTTLEDYKATWKKLPWYRRLWMMVTL